MGKHRFGGLLYHNRSYRRLQLSMGALQLLRLAAGDAAAHHLMLHPHLLLLGLVNLKPDIIGSGVGLLRVPHLRVVFGRGRAYWARLVNVMVLWSSSRYHDLFVALRVGGFVIVHTGTCHSGTCRYIATLVDSNIRIHVLWLIPAAVSGLMSTISDVSLMSLLLPTTITTASVHVLGGKEHTVVLSVACGCHLAVLTYTLMLLLLLPSWKHSCLHEGVLLTLVR